MTRSKRQGRFEISHPYNHCSKRALAAPLLLLQLSFECCEAVFNQTTALVALSFGHKLQSTDPQRVDDTFEAGFAHLEPPVFDAVQISPLKPSQTR